MGTGVTNEPSAVTSAKGRNKPLVQNLPEPKSRAYLSGVSGTDTQEKDGLHPATKS
jgi:hypothetical protein